MSFVRLTKRIEFSASHRYHNPSWNAARNRAVFGACTNDPGHGHNYLLDVTVAGTLNEDTGMVINLTDLKQVLATVLTEFDHKHLNLDTTYFTDRIPTTENIATTLWKLLSPRVRPQTVERIRLYEDADLYADVSPELVAAGEASITRRYHLAAAHRVPIQNDVPITAYGPCASPSAHGHNYTVSITVHGAIDRDTGMVTDLTALDRLVNDRVLARFNYRDLNEDPAFQHEPPTGENLARCIWRLITGKVGGGHVEKVEVRETEETSYEYVGTESGESQRGRR